VTAPVTAIQPLMITGCGVVSPAGIGLAALGTGACHQRADLAAIAEDLPPIQLSAVPDLTVEKYLGSKGVRHLDRTTKLALIACNRALAGLAHPLADEHRDRTGVMIGTSTGSIRSSSEFCRDTLVHDKPYLVRANLFPNSVMNCCASQIAIWNSLRGVNATLAGGRVASLAAIRYARNVITAGHVDRALVGGVEELSAQSAWAWHLSAKLAPNASLGEGCAVFVVETPQAATAAGRPPLAELLACEFGSGGAADERTSLTAGLAKCIERALRRSGVGAHEITTVSLGATGQRGLERIEERGVEAALGVLPLRQIRVASVIGETFSASGALQIAGLLAVWRADPTAGGVALVTSVGHDGNVGCLVVRRAADDVSHHTRWARGSLR
jgi:3-oxoacyl-[acyl-carrier-protein] synthase II